MAAKLNNKQHLNTKQLKSKSQSKLNRIVEVCNKEEEDVTQ